MKVDIQLLGKNEHHTLNFYEAALEVSDINELESQDIFIFPIELVYSIKHLITIVHLALDNLPDGVSAIDLKIAVQNLFYGRKKPFRSYYGKYVLIYFDTDATPQNKKHWDSGLKSLKGMIHCDIEQVKKTYGITDRQLEMSINLDDHICTAVNQQALKTF